MDSIKNYSKSSLNRIFGVKNPSQKQNQVSVEDGFHTQDSYILDDEQLEDDEIFDDLIPNGAFEGFLDEHADKSGVIAKDLLKHEVNVMYDTLDEYIRIGCDQPMLSYIKENIVNFVFQMRKEISIKRGTKRSFGEVSYIHDEKERSKHCKRTYLSKNC